MKITNVTVYPAKVAGKVKANGVVTLEESIDLKFIVMDGKTGPFISWQGGRAYDKKDGTKGWDSPIFVKDKALNDTITTQVMAKLKSVGGAAKPAASAQSNDASYAADDIPF